MILRRAVFFSYALLCMSATSFATPKEILVIRHAEKPIVGDEGIHLSDRGLQRANALPEFFLGHPDMNDNGAPVAVYAASPKIPTGSVRAYETIAPTAARLGLPVIRNFKSGEEDVIAQDILKNPAYNGKTVVVAWVRDELPLLGAALGVTETLRWPSSVFDRVWKFSFDSRGQVSLKTVQQSLLVGDQ